MSRASDSARNAAFLAATSAAARARAEANRTARAADRNTRQLGRGQNQHRGRIPIAPPSSSKFHSNTKFSNLAGFHKAPKSASDKIKYDFELDLKDGERSRLDYVYTSTPPNTPFDAFNPLLMAEKCEQSLGRKANSRARIMGHAEIALPNGLTVEQRHKLARDIADAHQHRLGVPVYLAGHEPHGNNGNWHLHMSFPLREVLPISEGGFKLGDKLPDFQSYDQRKKAGLQQRPTFTSDMREVVADRCADALHDAGSAIHLAERWRHGHKPLPAQVDAAIVRGDVDFVSENYGRDPTRKEGNSTRLWRSQSRSDQRRIAESHNRDIQAGTLGPEMLTRTLTNRVLILAERAGITKPEALRMLARDHSLNIEWVRAKGGKDAKVIGVRVQMHGGPKLAGKVVGASLPDLKRRFNWSEAPTYTRCPAKSGEAFDQYAAAVRDAGLDVVPGRPHDMLSQTVQAGLKRFDRLSTQARANAATQAQQEGAARSSGASAEGTGPTLPGPLESDTPVSTTTAQEGDNMVMHFKKAQQQKQQPNDVGDLADKVANVASVVKFIPPAAPVATAIETGARAVQVASKIDSATGGKASKLVSPMAGIKGIPGIGSGKGMKPGSNHQQQQHRPKPRP
jgi:hypothetical protein